MTLSLMLRATPGGADQSDDFRISLPGAQEKTALFRLNEKWMRPKGTTPTTHILKLPGLGSVFRSLVAEVLDRTPGVVDSVSSRLPKGFLDRLQRRYWTGCGERHLDLRSRRGGRGGSRTPPNTAGVTYL